MRKVREIKHKIDIYEMRKDAVTLLLQCAEGRSDYNRKTELEGKLETINDSLKQLKSSLK